MILRPDMRQLLQIATGIVVIGLRVISQLRGIRRALEICEDWPVIGLRQLSSRGFCQLIQRVVLIR